MKQIIASMTIGKDVSSLFPHVVKCMRTNNIELKKLIYLYIINYAKSKPDLIFLAIAAFNTDALDKSSPIIRALAVRTIGCIRVDKVTSYLCDILNASLKDEDAYVRKTACICVAKLYITNPSLVKENAFIDSLLSMLTDGNASVVANALAALNEISTLCGENVTKIRSKTLKRVLMALAESNEWGQIYILDTLAMFTPKKPKQAEDIIDSVLPRLNHANPAVVMSAVKVILKFLELIESGDNIRSYCKKMSNSLMTVMMAGPEIQYVLLR
jgi:AP-1 complex subunit beta-1